MTSPGFIAAIWAAVLWTLLFLRGLAGIRATPRLRPRTVESAVDAGCVTVVVPARNESEVIEPSIVALGAQSSAVERIIVVDDGSTDGTGERLHALARRIPRLTVLDGVGPKDGECGKPAALVHAMEHAVPATEWLLFIDADVVLERGAVDALLEAARTHGADLVSIIPFMETRTVLEAVVLPAVGSLILAAHPPAKVASPRSALAFANGQVILVRREVYARAGGHAAVVREILEDVRLAERVKATGAKLLLADGRAIARTRMYASWAELVEGWSKNLYLLVGGTPARALGWSGALLGLAWVGPLVAIFAGFPGLVALGLIIGYQATLRIRGGAAGRYAPLAPFGALVTAYLLLRSLGLHLRRQRIPWKGRDYSVTS